MQGSFCQVSTWQNAPKQGLIPSSPTFLVEQSDGTLERHIQMRTTKEPAMPTWLANHESTQPDWPAPDLAADTTVRLPDPAGSWAPLVFCFLFAPLGLLLGLVALCRHKATGKEKAAVWVGGALSLIAAIAVIASLASSPMAANGGFTNTSVLASSVQSTVQTHYQSLGMPITINSARCVLDSGSTYTCVLNEVDTVAGTAVPTQVPITVVISDNGNQWKSQ
jgi:hypothetical protein